MIDENSTREEVIKAVKRNGHALEYASETLKNDKDIVLETVKQNGYALQYASYKLRNDKEFMRLIDEIEKGEKK